MRNDNKFLYHLVLNHEDIQTNEAREVTIKQDGNSFYNNLSYYYTNTENYNIFFRKLLYSYIKENKISLNNPELSYDGSKIGINEYIENIKRDLTYTGELEISKCIEILNVNIAIYEKTMNMESSKVFYKFAKYSIN